MSLIYTKKECQRTEYDRVRTCEDPWDELRQFPPAPPCFGSPIVLKKIGVRKTTIFSPKKASHYSLTLTCSKRRMSFQRICALPTISEERMEDCSVMFAKLMRTTARR